MMISPEKSRTIVLEKDEGSWMDIREMGIYGGNYDYDERVLI